MKWSIIFYRLNDEWFCSGIKKYQNLALKCKRFSYCHTSTIICRIQPEDTLERIQQITFYFIFQIVCLQNVTIGWDVIGNNASLAYNYLSLLLWLLLFTIRPLLQLLHTTANYQDSLVIKGFLRLLFFLTFKFLWDFNYIYKFET